MKTDERGVFFGENAILTLELNTFKKVVNNKKKVNNSVSPVKIRLANRNDIYSIIEYYNRLSAKTKGFFSPHLFTYHVLSEIIESRQKYMPVIAENQSQNKVVGYAIVALFSISGDSFRLNGYDLKIKNNTDAFFAPSVADGWQKQGVGKLLFNYINNKLIQLKIERLFLWGGVKLENKQAIAFYLKNGFCILGRFVHEGVNLDMVKDYKE